MQLKKTLLHMQHGFSLFRIKPNPFNSPHNRLGEIQEVRIVLNMRGLKENLLPRAAMHGHHSCLPIPIPYPHVPHFCFSFCSFFSKKSPPQLTRKTSATMCYPHFSHKRGEKERRKRDGAGMGPALLLYLLLCPHICCLYLLLCPHIVL